METFLSIFQSPPTTITKAQLRNILEENPDLFSIIAGNLAPLNSPGKFRESSIYNDTLQLMLGMENRENIKPEISETLLYRVSSMINSGPEKSKNSVQLLMTLMFSNEIKLSKKMYTIDTIDDILSRTIYGLTISDIEIGDILSLEIPNLPINTHFMMWVSTMYELNLARINNMNFQSLTMDKSEYETEEIISKTLLILQKLISKKSLRIEFPPKNNEKYFKLNDNFTQQPMELSSDWNNDISNSLYNLYLNLLVSHFEICGYYSVVFLKEIRIYNSLLEYEKTNPLLTEDTRRTKIQKIMKNKGSRMNNIILINTLFKNIFMTEFFKEQVFEGIYRRTVLTYDDILQIPSNLLVLIDRVNTTLGLYIGMINNEEYIGLKDGYMPVIPDELKIIISRVIDYNYRMIGKENFLKFKNIFLPTIKIFEASKDLILKERLPTTYKYNDIVLQLSKIFIETNKETTDLLKKTKMEINKRYHSIINYFLEYYIKACLISPENSLNIIFNSIFSEENKRIRDNYFLVGISNINDAVDNIITIIKYKNELLVERQNGIDIVGIDNQLGTEYNNYTYYCNDVKVILRNLLCVELINGIMKDHAIFNKTLQMINSSIYNLIKIDYFKDKNYLADKNTILMVLRLMNQLYNYNDRGNELQMGCMIIGETREKLKELCDIEILIDEFQKLEQNLDKSQEDEEFNEEIPDEFLDPITYTPMKNPVVLPSSGIIVDKSTIINQLLHNEIDPYSRAKLTIDELEEYNNREENKTRCYQIIERFNNWKRNNKKKKENEIEVKEYKVKIDDEEYIIGKSIELDMDKLD